MIPFPQNQTEDRSESSGPFYPYLYLEKKKQEKRGFSCFVITVGAAQRLRFFRVLATDSAITRIAIRATVPPMA